MECIVIMKNDYIQQIGTPEEVFSDPVNVFVAGFIGNPPTNFIEARVEAGKVLFGEGCAISLSKEERSALADYEGKEIILGIRPENIHLASDEALQRKTETFEMTCEFVELLGFEIAVYFKNGERDLIMKIPSEHKVQPGEEVEICFHEGKLMFFDVETERRVK